MRDALVFGGSGQIGVPVIGLLLENGWRVHAVSRAPQIEAKRLTWLRGDLQKVEGIPSRVDAIFSLGPLDHFSHWYARSDIAAQRVIAFGSTSVQTKQESSDGHERDLAMRLQQAEARLFETAAARSAAATVLRPTLVYGVGRDRSLSQIAAVAQRFGFFLLPRGAHGLRQPVHVEDLATAALTVVDAAASHGRSYALPGGETLQYVEMVSRTLSALQTRPRLLQVPAWLFDIVLSAAQATGRMRGLGAAAVKRMREDLVFDIEPARRDFGYSPRAFRPTASDFFF